MKLRHASTLVLVALALVGCGKKKTAPAGPTTPATVETTTTADTAAERLAREAAIREEEAERERQRIRAALSEVVYFDYDSFEINPESEERLRTKAEVLRRHPNVRVRVEGHADQRGSTEYNLVLGQKRAEAVRDFLSAYGISADRISTLSYGKERPRAEGETEDAFARNRRAEFAVLGGLP